MVQPVGIEPTSTVLQTAAMTTSAKVAWCPNRDSNSDAEAVASKTTVSTNSTIGANHLILEQDIGFEPMTFSLATRHSTTELILQFFF
jgi:hypothetical protein